MPKGDRGVRVSASVTETDWAYLAGIIDGEGTVSLHTHNVHKKSYPRIVVTQSQTELLLHIKNLFDGSVECHQPTGTKVGKTNYCSTKPTWRWNTMGANAAFILEKCLPYMIVKREKAELVLTKYAAERLALSAVVGG